MAWAVLDTVLLIWLPSFTILTLEDTGPASPRLYDSCHWVKVHKTSP